MSSVFDEGLNISSENSSMYELENFTDYSEHWTQTDDEEFGEINMLAFFTVYVIIVVAGFIGNFLNFALFSSNSYRFYSFSVYLRALSISDTLVLTVNLVEDINGKLLDDTLSRVKALCPFTLFFGYFGQLFSAYLLVVVAVDRYVAVVHPFKRSSLCTFRRAVWITVTGVLFSSSVCIGIITWEAVESFERLMDYEYRCPLIDDYDSFFILSSVIFLAFITMIPFVVVVTLNIKVLFSIKSSVKLHEVARTGHTKSRIQTKTTMSLILTTCLSVLFNLPLAITEIVELFIDFEIIYVFHVVIAIHLLNYSLNFYVFAVHNRQYRMTIKKLVRSACCLRSSSKSLRTIAENTSS